MQQGIPVEETVLEYFSTLSNWGRWGAEDQLGTLNFLSPEKTRRAVSLVREGVTLSCARTIRYDAGPPLLHLGHDFLKGSTFQRY